MQKLPVDGWESPVPDLVAFKLDREQATGRRKLLLKQPKKKLSRKRDRAKEGEG